MIHKLFTWPIDTVRFVGEKVQEEVDKQLYDVDHIQQKLVHLEMMLEMDEISEEVYEKQQVELMGRYRIAKEKEQAQLRESLEDGR
ncbi:gas vesicle protein GvpG [Salipaludibacillus neizhouensis]|uniref:Gas vesicle protein GvpG n=1 Tax=Salipaludibacillus neizhouensis TaxID=885475 RepID=A0A3A9K9G7_9BACI|nr:gas vesicle protein GvpG [Salipaludibacillus neizhouensis]RKL66293.1 gas vesicle protein GvpG [Salipaludibacillus neizhouensis]